jgi:hypothetical protein
MAAKSGHKGSPHLQAAIDHLYRYEIPWSCMWGTG